MQKLKKINGASTLILSAIVLSAASCETISAGNFCEIYEPVPTLGVGTEEQKLKVDQNNGYYLEKCLEGV